MFLSLLGSSRSYSTFAYWHLSELLIPFFVNHRRTRWCPGTSEKCCTHVRVVSTTACSSRCWVHTSAISSSMGAFGFRSLFRQVWMTPNESPFLSRLKIFFLSRINSDSELYLCVWNVTAFQERSHLHRRSVTIFLYQVQLLEGPESFRILPELFFMSPPVIFSVHVDTSVTTLAT